MKLLEITRSYYPSVGGLEKFVYDRLHIYKSLGIDYKILSTNFSNKKKDLNHKNENCTIIKQYTPYNITPNISDYFSNDYDLISVNQIGRYFSDRAIYYFSGKGKKIILTPHFTFHTNRFGILKKFYNTCIMKKLLLKCNAIVCFTDYEKKYWNKIFEVPVQMMHVIPHYLECATMLEQTEDYQQEEFLLYLGRADKNKRIDLLINAFHSLNISKYKLKLTLDYDDLSNISKRILKEDKRIELLGYISESDKDRYLRNCSAVIYPSEFEAFGFVLLEASEYKKPILCSNLAVFSEILDHRGVIFFENTLGSIQTALLEFYKLTDDERKVMGAHNFKQLEKYSFESALEKYRELFDKLIPNP